MALSFSKSKSTVIYRWNQPAVSLLPQRQTAFTSVHFLYTFCINANCPSANTHNDTVKSLHTTMELSHREGEIDVVSTVQYSTVQNWNLCKCRYSSVFCSPRKSSRVKHLRILSKFPNHNCKLIHIISHFLSF